MHLWFRHKQQISTICNTSLLSFSQVIIYICGNSNSYHLGFSVDIVQVFGNIVVQVFRQQLYRLGFRQLYRLGFKQRLSSRFSVTASEFLIIGNKDFSMGVVNLYSKVSATVKVQLNVLSMVSVHYWLWFHSEFASCLEPLLWSTLHQLCYLNA